MHTTDNYQLSQWDAADRILMSDFNSDNAKIDAAIAEQAADLAAVAAKMGNCRLEYMTYTGTGTYGPANCNTLTFAVEPLLAIIAGTVGNSLFIYNGMGTASVNSNSVFFTWSGNTVSWYSNSDAGTQFNNRCAYRVIVVYASE